MALYEQRLIRDKRGVSLAGWIEGGLGVVLLLVLLGLLIGNMNAQYSKTYNNSTGAYDPTFKMQSDSVKEEFIDYQNTVEKGMEGEATTSSLTGINLGTTWSMTRAGLKIAFDIVTGGWIENAVGLLNLGEGGEILGLILRLLFVISIGLVLLRMILKINP